MVCERLGYAVVTDAESPFGIAIFWTVRTIRRPDARLAGIAAHSPVLNYACRSIAKRHVDRIFTSIFGYSSLVNPAVHGDACVRKSNLNAMKDSRFVKRPVRRASRRFVYQRLIDTTVDQTCVEELRTSVIGGGIPVVYVVRKPVTQRFGDPTSVWFVDAREVFSRAEIDSICLFCQAMGLDYAELDILRDRFDGRIFIIDANPTSWTFNLPEAELRAADDRQGRAFERLVQRLCS
jgi:hypothetical protein